jgi:RNA polymerase sigma-70 factor (ECF subfamily)
MDMDEFISRFEKIKASLYRIAFLYLGSETIALDALDEAVYKAMKSLKKLLHPEYFETWIMRILINECKKELRRRKREVNFEIIPETAVDDFDHLPLKEAIIRLPTELKEVIILRFFAGFTQIKTAESLKIPQGTVVTRQRRALKLLKLELSEEE